MRKGTTGEARIVVRARPDAVYDMISDVTRMGEWSPETRKCEWLDGATGPTVGARFKGQNRRGILRWSTKPRVLVADPGREFSFRTEGSSGSTAWTYRFEPSGEGTEIIESFELLKDTSKVVDVVERLFWGVSDRKADIEAAMGQTLQRIKAVAEADGRSGDPGDNA